MIRNKYTKIFSAIALSCALAGLSGCGLKGDLYLPDEAESNVNLPEEDKRKTKKDDPAEAVPPTAAEDPENETGSL